MTVSISSIKAGDKVMAGYKSFKDENTFLGFTDNAEKYSVKPVFNTLTELYAAKGVSNLKDLEAHEKAAGLPYGHGFYAVFQSSEDGDTWSAFLDRNRFSVGSSSDALKLAAI